MYGFSSIRAEFLYFKFHQDDGYASYPPLHENYINKLINERIIVNVDFENISNERKTNFSVYVRTLDLYDTIRIEKFRFLFDEKQVDVAVKRRFNLSKEIDSFEGLPPHYYSYFFEERTKQKINFQKIFSSHLKEKEKFPLKVVIFYSIDGGEIREVMYNFEVRCFRHFYISPYLALWLVYMFFLRNTRFVLAMIYGDTQDYNEWQYRHIEYSPYGEMCIEEVAARLYKLPFRFTGKELDEEAELYYYGAGYLDSKYRRCIYYEQRRL